LRPLSDPFQTRNDDDVSRRVRRSVRNGARRAPRVTNTIGRVRQVTHEPFR
jgi:hypothetical protein